jgi:hypothetical protein
LRVVLYVAVVRHSDALQAPLLISQAVQFRAELPHFMFQSAQLVLLVQPPRYRFSC